MPGDCETHFNVKSGPYCPICLLNERDRYGRELEDASNTLLMIASGLLVDSKEQARKAYEKAERALENPLD